MMKRKAAARPQAGRFRRVSRAGTSSVVAAYTGLSRSFGAAEAYSGFAACAKVLCTLLQFRNKKPLTSVTIGGNI